MNLYVQDFMESTRVRYYVYAVSYHLVWQIDYGIFHRPIMARTQIQNKDFGAVSQTDLISRD